MQKMRTLTGVVLALAAVACSNPPANPGTDTGMPGPDVGTGDAGPMADTGARPDTNVMHQDAAIDGGGSTNGTCAMPIDLNTAGTAPATGTGRSISSTNASSAAGVMAGLANGTCADDGGTSTATHEVVFSYTVQTGGHLSASTNDPMSDPDLDSIVWILDACTDAAGELACNDDVGFGELLSTAVSDTSVAAGSTVFIVVAGYEGADVEAGAFRLNVLELPDHAIGQACDTDTDPFCVTGATCITDEGADTAGHCLADGSEYGLCHTTGTACDAGLVCSNAMPTADDPGTCQTPIAGNMPCTARHSVCVMDFTCIADEGSDTMGHCLADGSEYGLCRLTGTACDGTLVCSQATPTADHHGTCQMPIAADAMCGGRHFVCVTGYSCQLDEGSDTTGHCLADGAEYGACRLTGMACDTGFTCSVATPTADDNGTCQVPLADGAACTAHHYLCVAGDHCVDDGSGTTGTCIADGTAQGAWCRDAAPECDAPLACDPLFGVCLTP